MYLNWQSQDKDYYAIDIEGDSLEPKIVYCMCWENIKTQEKGEAIGHAEIKSFFDRTRGSSVYVGHNILKFDVPVLNKLIGAGIRLGQIVDTLILCTLYHPNIPNGHSLAAWGERLGELKDDFNDFSKFTQEMLKYCHQDVKVTAKLYRRLTAVMLKIGFSEKSCYIQHYFTSIIHRQHKTGFFFNEEQAINLYRELRQIEEDLQNEIRNVFPPSFVQVRDGEVYTKTGSPKSIYLKDCERFQIRLYDEGRSYRAIRQDDFNIGSPKQRVEKLLELGWEAEEFTPTGQPKTTEKSLVKFSEEMNIPEVALITRWMAVNGRANMINTWLENLNHEDSCIHGKLFVADTLRLRHQAPNTANIPAVRVREIKDSNGKVIQKIILKGQEGLWTYEARDLWQARPGRVLGGTDAAGLELRMLAHELNRADFTDGVVNGDPHQVNADLAGVTRPQAKTLIYAVCYGAGAPKIAKTLKVPLAEGTAIRQRFLDNLGLEDLVNACKEEQQNGRISLCDGSQIVCQSPHAALNYKLQGGGARVMAQAAIFLEGYLLRHGLDCLKVGDIHDEWQYDCDPRDAEEFRRLSVQAIKDSGEELNLRVPLDGESKVGRTWAETH